MSRLIYMYYLLIIACCIFTVLSYVNYLFRTPITNSLREEISVQYNYTGWSPSLSIPLVTIVCSSINPTSERAVLEKFKTNLESQKAELRVMLGTLLYFSSAAEWRVYIVTDNQKTFDVVTDGLEKAWPKPQYQRLHLKRRALKMPLNLNLSCSWQKLFLDLIFLEYDSLVYVDPNVLFAGPAEKLWNEFKNFNHAQAVGASPEPWYTFKQTQNTRQTGLNTGVLTLNLTRLKSMPHGGLGYAIVNEFYQLKNESSALEHEQYAMNNLMRKYPQILYEMEFKWNFVPSDCSEVASQCKLCSSEGITIVNGANGLFYKNYDFQYHVIYYVMDEVTKNLTLTPKDLLLLYEGAMNTFHTFYLGETICHNFSDFFNLTSHAIRKMASAD